MLLLTEFHGRATAAVDATADDVFRLLTSPDRLPEWNDAIESVIDAPVPLAVDAEWVVQMHVPPGARWPSRSRVVVLDAERHRFEHLTQSDDGNPSYATWSWAVDEGESGSVVTVEWSVHPVTFWRRFLLARLRRRQLPGEAAASLQHLARQLAPAAS